MTEIAKNEKETAVLGDYLPLSVYAKRGYETTNIEAKAEKLESDLVGWVYRVPTCELPACGAGGQGDHQRSYSPCPTPEKILECKIKLLHLYFFFFTVMTVYTVMTVHGGDRINDSYIEHVVPPLAPQKKKIITQNTYIPRKEG